MHYELHPLLILIPGSVQLVQLLSLIPPLEHPDNEHLNISLCQNRRITPLPDCVAVRLTGEEGTPSLVLADTTGACKNSLPSVVFLTNTLKSCSVAKASPVNMNSKCLSATHSLMMGCFSYSLYDLLEIFPINITAGYKILLGIHK